MNVLFYFVCLTFVAESVVSVRGPKHEAANEDHLETVPSSSLHFNLFNSLVLSFFIVFYLVRMVHCEFILGNYIKVPFCSLAMLRGHRAEPACFTRASSVPTAREMSSS